MARHTILATQQGIGIDYGSNSLRTSAGVFIGSGPPIGLPVKPKRYRALLNHLKKQLLLRIGSIAEQPPITIRRMGSTMKLLRKLPRTEGRHLQYPSGHR